MYLNQILAPHSGRHKGYRPGAGENNTYCICLNSTNCQCIASTGGSELGAKGSSTSCQRRLHQDCNQSCTEGLKSNSWDGLWLKSQLKLSVLLLSWDASRCYRMIRFGVFVSKIFQPFVKMDVEGSIDEIIEVDLSLVSDFTPFGMQIK